MAKDICDSYRAGTSFRGEVDYLVSVAKATYGQAGAMIGMSTSTYCPEFNNRH